MQSKEHFTWKILDWYDHHHRDLPWRHTKDPYKIWLSEIILQQTRVNQGMPYYLKFVERFSGIRELATASQEEILKLWQGLGYYSRARNLHAGARQVLERYNGVLPSDYEALLGIKGIGEYTAAAIASIAFDQPHPVLDGNVYRVIARLFGIEDPVQSPTGKKKVMKVLKRIIDTSRPGKFNQAMMEFGALQCIPVNPECNECPFQSACQACRSGQVDRLPVPKVKKSPLHRYFHYVVPLCKHNNQVVSLVYPRKEGDIWAGLYEFPLIESDAPLSNKELSKNPVLKEWKEGVEFKPIYESGEIIHKLTHRVIHAYISIIRLNKMSQITDKEGYKKIYLNNKINVPLPRLIDRFLQSEGLRIFLKKEFGI